MSDAPIVLIAAASGRALAASARRASYTPLVVDFFADDDTRDIAQACLRVEGGLERGFQAETLMAACEQLAGSSPIAGFVYGSGFENRPILLDAVAQRWRLLGNPGEVVSRLKDPLIFAQLCRDCAIPHPETTLERPGESGLWVARQRGAAGGGHIRAVHNDTVVDAQTYYQRRVAGRPVSALVLADGIRCTLVGFSEQWTSPTVGRPFRYGGAVRPAALTPAMARSLTRAIERLASHIPIVGLNSMDFMVAEEDFRLLEVNPRPGATLDIFDQDDAGGDALFLRHIAACNGELPAIWRCEGARAAVVVYAERDMVCPARMEWPAWARDRQSAGSFVATGDPFCTIIADDQDVAGTLRLLKERSASLRLLIRARAA